MIAPEELNGFIRLLKSAATTLATKEATEEKLSDGHNTYQSDLHLIEEAMEYLVLTRKENENRLILYYLFISLNLMFHFIVVRRD